MSDQAGGNLCRNERPIGDGADRESPAEARRTMRVSSADRVGVSMVMMVVRCHRRDVAWRARDEVRSNPLMMRKIVRMRFSWPIVAGLVLIAGRGEAVEMTLRRAVLTLGGVGTFEYEAAADATGEVVLSIRRGDVSDVLKSLTVLGGASRISGLRLPGPDSAAAAFEALPFPASALAEPFALMNALRGVPVEVRDASGREIVLHGRLLGALRDHEPSAGARDGLERTRVSVMTEAGLRQFVLEDSGAVLVGDPVLRARLDEALAALRGQASGDRTNLTLQLQGGAGTVVRIAVVTAAPLWKATYRLALPVMGGTTARLQGWAVFENASANDWNQVAVALRTGNPVTFRQDVYEPALVERPEIPVGGQGRLAPRVEEAAVAPMAASAPVVSPAPPPDMRLGRMKTTPRPDRDFAAPAAGATMVEAVAATTFELPTPVTLPVGQTASMPFLDIETQAESLALLAFGEVHPRAAVRLTNATGGALPGGAVATFDPEGFAGDALLSPLPPGETRLLTFAEDAAITARWDQTMTRDVSSLGIAGGVARLTRIQRTTTKVELGSVGRDAKALLLDLPRIDGARLEVAGATLVEQTANQWRLRAALPAGGHGVVTATADRLVHEDIALTDDSDAILRLRDLSVLSTEAHSAIARVAALRREETAQTAERDRIAARRETIVADEQRLRDNLAAVPASDPLHARLLRQLDSAETSLQELAIQQERAADAARKARDATATAIAALSIRG